MVHLRRKRAPAIAHETDPLIGLDPGGIVFFVNSENSQETARRIAASLQQ
jgi:hypothetical protein